MLLALENPPAERLYSQKGLADVELFHAAKGRAVPFEICLISLTSKGSAMVSHHCAFPPNPEVIL